MLHYPILDSPYWGSPVLSVGSQPTSILTSQGSCHSQLKGGHRGWPSHLSLSLPSKVPPRGRPVAPSRAGLFAWPSSVSTQVIRSSSRSDCQAWPWWPGCVRELIFAEWNLRWRSHQSQGLCGSGGFCFSTQFWLLRLRTLPSFLGLTQLSLLPRKSVGPLYHC